MLCVTLYSGTISTQAGLTLVTMRHILYYAHSQPVAPVPKPEPKGTRLKALGVANPHPERVQASWFQTDTFFDPRDLVQVKYEMLRLVVVEGTSKAEAAARFGLSRPTYYQAEAAFTRDGLMGLAPRQRGPKAAHKLNTELMAFIEAQINQRGRIQARSLARLIEAQLGVRVHPRSIERAIKRKKKRPAPARG